jgi:hypothetical protein
VLFFATQKVLFVRNLLPVAPFIAIFAARGLTSFAWSLPDRARALPGLLGACVLILNGAWMWDASASIRERQAASRDDLGELQRWLETERGERSVFFSEPLARELYAKLGAQPDWLIVDQAAPADLAAFRPAEVAVGAFPGDPSGTLKSNLPGSLVVSFCPREVNWEWYTTWREPRIVVIERSFLEPLQRKSEPAD